MVSRTDFEDVPVEDRVSRAYASAPLVRKQTSGSTGIPLVIFIDEKVASFRSWRFRRPHFEAGETSPTSLEFLFPERFRRDRQVRVVGTLGRRKTCRRGPRRSYSTLTDALKSPELIYNDLAGKTAGDADRLCELDRQARRMDGLRAAAALGQADLDHVGDAHA